MYRTAAVLLLVATLGSAAHATGKEEARAAAKALFLRATRHYNIGEFREALADYKEGYRNVADPVFLFNVGQCQRMLGEFEAAIFSYRAYLRSLPEAENRAQVDQRIAEMEEAQRRSIRQGPPDISSAPAPQESVAPQGVTAPGSPTGAKKTDTKKTDDQKTDDQKTDAKKTDAKKTAKKTGGRVVVAPLELTASPRGASATPVYKRWWPWTLGAAVVVGAGLGIGLGLGLSGHDNIASSALGNVDLR